MIKGKSFAGQDTPRLVDTEYQQCNFSTRQPGERGGLKVGVRLFPGDDTPRTFIKCNLINRELPPGSTVVGGNRALIEYDVVSVSHVIDIDGEEITMDDYENVVYGRYTESGIEYKGTPEVIEQPSRRGKS